MDLATHALAGVLLARVRPGWIGRRDVALTLVGAALIPDVDVIAIVLDPTHAALERHTLTHSLAFMPVMAAAIALAGRLAGARLSFAHAFGLALLGIASHLLLDLVNAYGVALLHPFSDARFELPLLFVLDPVLTGMLAAMLAASVWVARDARRKAAIACAAFALAAVHLGAAALLRGEAAVLLAAVDADRPDLRRELVPEPLSPWRWRGIVEHAGGYRQVLIAPHGGTVTTLPDVASAADDPHVAVVRRSGLLREADPFLRAPVWTVDGSRVTVHDLRFRFAALGNQWDPFLFAFDVDGAAVRPVRASLGERIDRTLATLGEIVTAPMPRRAAAGG